MKWCKIGDLHFGEKGNSQKFNEQVLDLLRFAVQQSKQRGVTHCFQFGDYYDNRSKIDVSTLHYGILGAQILADGFDVVKTIVSNHDIYHRDRLDVTSMSVLHGYIDVISEPTMISDTVIAVPWITSESQWDKAIKASLDNGAKYMFGHLELNGFMVNDMYEMEHGYSPVALKHLDAVYTGHYHSPQSQGNIHYIGTPYPITMNEANQPHGIYFFDDETGEVEFVEYTKVRVISVPYTELSSVTENADIDPSNTYIRVEFPDDLADETEITAVQKKLEELGFTERKIKYTPSKMKELLTHDVGEIKEVENIDSVVLTFIRNPTTPVAGINYKLLDEIYRTSVERGVSND